MSVRIYELSKDLGMENAELITLLKERGFQVKSASSTVDNISADALRDEFSPKEATSSKGEVVQEISEEKAEVKAAIVSPPSGALVRTKEDIERERAENEANEAKSKGPPSLVPPKPGGGKAPPPLPGGPSVMIRKPVVNLNKSMVAPSNAPSLKKPSAPVLRTDIKEEPKAPVAEGSPVVNKASESKPAPMTPPRVSMPKPMAPPVSAPQKMGPPAPVPASVESEVSVETDDEAVAVAPAKKLRKLEVKAPIVVRDFAVQIGKKPFQLISELMELSIFASMNTAIDEDVAVRIAERAGFELEIRHRGEAGAELAEVAVVIPEDDESLMEPRPPVVCVLGHVDHGKTTLLDSIRKANVVSSEAGGITQHIGAYQVTHKEHKISFIDTPGHAAFSNMRARGANTTDIAILVVAADDGFMLQTDEAMSHARKAGVPIIVAINKMDAAGANVEKVFRQMQERELSPEDWGGETLVAKVSALKGEGIEELLDQVILQAEIMETLKANPNADAEGVVLEAQKEVGRGCTASVIVQRGTLKPGMALVCGEHYCRVRQLLDDNEKPVHAATPATPVKIVGWSGPPASGDRFIAVKNERIAKRAAEENEQARKKLEAAQRQEEDGPTSIEDLFAAIEKTQKPTFRVVVKADVYGTAEALATSLLSIHSTKINLEVIDMGVGTVTRNDVSMASTGGAAVVAFNVGVEKGVEAYAKHNEVEIIAHKIIYEVIDAVKDRMADRLEPELRENKVGAAEVRAVFPLSRGFVAGCMVTEGKILRNGLARIYRKGEMIAQSGVSTLRRFKDDVGEVRAGYECGIALKSVNDYKEGDMIEVFETEKIKPSL